MHDVTGRWPDPRQMPNRILRDGLSILPMPARAMTLISGPMPAALAACGQARAWGWPEPVPDGPVALALRRDRILMLGGPRLAEGWDAERGLAVSVMDGAWSGLMLGGRHAFDLLRMGTEIWLDRPSASVARLFLGIEVILWHSAEEEFRMIVPTPRAAFIWQALGEFAQDLTAPHAEFAIPDPRKQARPGVRRAGFRARDKAPPE